jgi:hypothetical protein
MPYHERGSSWEAAQLADHTLGGRSGQEAGAELPVIRAVGDMITFIEDQLQSCGLQTENEPNGGHQSCALSRNAEVILTLQRLIKLSDAGNLHFLLAAILRDAGLDTVIDIFLGVLRVTLGSREPRLVPRLPQSEQLSLNFDGSTERPVPRLNAELVTAA